MLRHDDIALRIPHQGRMCLLEQVVEWDVQRIQCKAISHRASDNPLRAQGRLGIACGIEYAAQAMALHGALIGAAAGGNLAPPRVGYLASVRSVILHASRLDDVEGDLSVSAECLMGDASNIVYSFHIEAGTRPLLSGRATVVLDPSMSARLGGRPNS